MNTIIDKSDLIKLILEKIRLNKDNSISQWNCDQNCFTRHFILDDFLPEELCRSIYDDYILADKNFVRGRAITKQNKKTLKNLDFVSAKTQNLYRAIHSEEFLSEIAEIVGIKSIESDPSLYAGGLSVMNKNDYLNPHIDNSHDARRLKYRRLNFLFYITPDWNMNNGGSLELWNKSVTKNLSIESKFNRLVIMETNKSSWHSVNKIKVEGSRCCLSTYFFTKNSPENYQYFHVTSFNGRPDQKLLRLYSPLDNFIRNCVAQILNHGR